MPLHRNLFIEANPIPVKWAMARMGLCGGALRLPLTQLTERRQLRFHDVTRVGDDLRILARFAEAATPSSATPNKE